MMAAFAALRDRDLAGEGIVIAEGRLLSERLLAACASASPPAGFKALGVTCVASLAPLFQEATAGLCPLEILSEGEIAGLAGFPFHRGVIAAARRPALAEFDASDFACRPEGAGPSRILVLPATKDPENLGSMLRSAAALGYGAILVGPDTCDHLCRRVVRVSMGAVFSLPVFALGNPSGLEALRACGYALAAAVLDPQARDLRDWLPPPRLGLLIGNEFEGLGAPWLGPDVERLTIPMSGGADSLNAASAAAIFLWASRSSAGKPDAGRAEILAPEPGMP